MPVMPPLPVAGAPPSKALIDAAQPWVAGPALSALTVAAGEFPGPLEPPPPFPAPLRALTVAKLPDGPCVALPIFAAAAGPELPPPPLFAALPLPTLTVATLPLGPDAALRALTAATPPLDPEPPLPPP